MAAKLRSYGCGDGLYLIKESQSQPGCFALTGRLLYVLCVMSFVAVCNRGGVEHYLIDRRREDGKLGIKQGMRYNTLNEVVLHYQ